MASSNELDAKVYQPFSSDKDNLITTNEINNKNAH